jgi:hypothetical protein
VKPYCLVTEMPIALTSADMSTGGTIENRRLDQFEKLDHCFQRLSWFFILISVGIVFAASVDWINGQHRYVAECVTLSWMYRRLARSVPAVMRAATLDGGPHSPLDDRFPPLP